MTVITRGSAAQVHPATVLLHATVVVLTLATAAIHASLGGVMFTANAVGYTVLAVAMVAPGAASRWRWLTRLTLIGFTAATIGGWVAFGARFDLAYLDKAIEGALIGGLLIEMWRSDGGPVGVYRRIRRLISNMARATSARNAR